MLENLRSPLKKIIEPLAAALVRAHISANAVTVAGSVLTIVVAICTGMSGYLFAGTAVLTVLVLFDSLDGSVAALSGGGTAFGAFLDSTLDRIADWVLLLAVILYFALHTPIYNAWTIIGIINALTAMLTSFVTPYARARAEAVGFEAKNGIATRADRIAIILIALAVHGLGAPLAVLALAMLLLTVLGIITVFQRIATVYKQSVRSV
ncbi:phosphatidylinositol phosphate synthase [Alloscardovia sp. HMSC034E08]|uniref:phosphatidylinositol phosphate synthase n=1 Tax=Alloscardovia sp. HMSC034E08 TaxID=1739413 RepID=UPI0008ABDB93|nr:CDP-alcohol phosphatidyltransferase family protein [Alloscardovia sp. HMSC034E08]OFR00087.1 CDP-diacylglycerol--glycerol-3-phosphate 3-phosphatidyltransferase [Alloscardovia sp. HMSC034E08]